MKETPGDQRGSVATALLVTAVMLFVHLLAAAVLIQFMCRFVPPLVVLFDEHNVEIPWITQNVIATSYVFSLYWYLPVLLLPPVDGALLLVPRLLGRRTAWLSTCWFSAMLTGVILYLGYAHVALYLPLTVVVQQAR